MAQPEPKRTTFNTDFLLVCHYIWSVVDCAPNCRGLGENAEVKSQWRIVDDLLVRAVRLDVTYEKN